jgi:hypothetical protein
MPMSSDGKRSLTDATDALSTRVNALSRQLTLSQRQHAITKWLLGITAVLAIAALIGGFVVYDLSNSNRETQVKTCEYGNSTREAQRAAWGELLNVSTASLLAQAEATGEDPPKAVLAYYKAFTHWIDTSVFPDRDCEDLDQQRPVIGPPPSFEDALKEALREQTGR